jgi:hypothetical protein
VLPRVSPTQQGVEQLPIQARVERYLVQVESPTVGLLDYLVCQEATKNLSFVFIRGQISLGR